MSLGGRDFTIKSGFLDDISAASLETALAHLGAALLVLHAPHDAVVGIKNASSIFLAAKHPKSFITLDDADHLITREADARYVADMIGSWSSRYLDLAPDPATAAAPEGVVRISETDADGFRQDISVGGKHQLVADEPTDMGGTDEGPSPYQLVSAGLGACTAMTLRLYARRKGIPLTHVAVDVTHNRRHAEDCEDCESTQPKVDVFSRVIRLQGDLSDDHRAALLIIADKCPVHKTLHAQALIETALA